MKETHINVYFTVEFRTDVASSVCKIVYVVNEREFLTSFQAGYWGFYCWNLQTVYGAHTYTYSMSNRESFRGLKRPEFTGDQPVVYN